MVVLDTSIIIDHLRQALGIETVLSRVNQKEGVDYLCISVISIQELFEGKSTKETSKLYMMLSILSPIKVLEYNSNIAELGGKIACESVSPIEFADAAIAATCIYNDFELLTLNRKHFDGIRHLRLYNL